MGVYRLECPRYLYRPSKLQVVLTVILFALHVYLYKCWLQPRLYRQNKATEVALFKVISDLFSLCQQLSCFTTQIINKFTSLHRFLNLFLVNFVLLSR
jgi:hypothetical protein